MNLSTVSQKVSELDRSRLEEFLQLAEQEEILTSDQKADLLGKYDEFARENSDLQLGASLVRANLLQPRDLVHLIEVIQSQSSGTGSRVTQISLPSAETVEKALSSPDNWSDLDEKFIEKALEKHILWDKQVEVLKERQEAALDRGYSISLSALAWQVFKVSPQAIEKVYREVLGDQVTLAQGEEQWRVFEIPEEVVPELEMAALEPEPLDMSELEAEPQVIDALDAEPEVVSALDEEPEVLDDLDAEPEEVSGLDAVIETVSPEEAMDSDEYEAVSLTEGEIAGASPSAKKRGGGPNWVEIATTDDQTPQAKAPSKAKKKVTKKKTAKKKAAPTAKIAKSIPADPPTHSDPAITEKLGQDLQELVTSLLAPYQQVLEALQQGDFSAVTAEPTAVENTGADKKKKKKKKEYNKIEFNGKTYKHFTKEDLAAALEKKKPIRGAYIDSLRFPEGPPKHKLKILNCAIGWLDFEGVVFEQDLDMTNCVFPEKANFKGVTFRRKFHAKRATFLKGADFTNACFEKELNLNGTRFERYVSFRNALFKNRTVFAKNQWEGGANFSKAVFDKEVSYSESSANYRFTFNKTIFKGPVKFSNSVYNDYCDFSDTQFQDQTNFIRTQFYGPVKFSRVRFDDEANFTGAFFMKDTFFTGAKFMNLVNLTGVQGEGNFGFQDVDPVFTTSFIFTNVNINRIFMERKLVDGHIYAHRQGDFATACKDYGIIKTNFRNINAYSDEDWAYYMEKRMSRFCIPLTPSQPVKFLRRFFDWFALDVGCGYGTKPLNILFVSMALIAGFAALYMAFPNSFSADGHSGDEFGIVAALVTSFKAFAGAEVGEWSPEIGEHLMTLMVMVESFLGIFIMTVLVVTFSRKVIR